MNFLIFIVLWWSLWIGVSLCLLRAGLVFAEWLADLECDD